ncbi:MAG: NAD-dependent epimerase/dehydratase family protein [candidate division WOR-3 bacterium]
MPIDTKQNLMRTRTVSIKKNKKDKVLITGGAGFIGSHLAHLLTKLTYEVVIIDDLSTGRLENIPNNARFYQIDIKDPEVKSVIIQEKPKILFHLAALTDTTVSEAAIRADIEVNLIGTINILAAASEAKCEKFIFTSTAAVYGNCNHLPIPEVAALRPISAYGIGKLACENYIARFCEFHRMGFTILRYANVFGPRQFPKGGSGAIPIFIKKMLTNQTPTIYGDGKQIRDYVYIDDVVSATLKAMAKGNNKILNISSGKGTTTRQLYKLIANVLKFNQPPEFINTRQCEIKKSILANNLAKKILNWHPKTDLLTGIKKTIDWWQSQK